MERRAVGGAGPPAPPLCRRNFVSMAHLSKKAIFATFSFFFFFWYTFPYLFTYSGKLSGPVLLEISSF